MEEKVLNAVTHRLFQIDQAHAKNGNVVPEEEMPLYAVTRLEFSDFDAAHTHKFDPTQNLLSYSNLIHNIQLHRALVLRGT